MLLVRAVNRSTYNRDGFSPATFDDGIASLLSSRKPEPQTAEAAMFRKKLRPRPARDA
jgi:hypothetical protein